MKTMGFIGTVIATVFLLGGCASSKDYKSESGNDARWVVVSTNDPVSSDSVGRTNDSGAAVRVPAVSPSVLLAPENQVARQEIETGNLSPMLKKEMLDGNVLTLADLEDLGRAKISEGTIVKYLRGTRAVYVL